MHAPVVRKELAPARGRVEIRDLSVRFDAHAALEKFDLVIEPGEFVCLLGPSGCGAEGQINAFLLKGEAESFAKKDGGEVKDFTGAKLAAQGAATAAK